METRTYQLRSADSPFPMRVQLRVVPESVGLKVSIRYGDDPRWSCYPGQRGKRARCTAAEFFTAFEAQRLVTVTRLDREGA